MPAQIQFMNEAAHRVSTSVLPAGVRDFLPAQARALYALQARVLDVLDAWAYARISTPTFERLDVLRAGLGEEGAGRVFRLVDPQSGDVLALRPDITSQVARLASTRLRASDLPLRVAYAGRVYRLAADADYPRREVYQVGAEHIGTSGAHADVEIAECAYTCVRAAGISRHVLALGHVGIVRALIAALPPLPTASAFGGMTLRTALRDRMLARDVPSIRALLSGIEVSSKIRGALEAVATLRGGVDVLESARALLAGSPAESAFRALERCVGRLLARLGPGASVLVDLGEARGFDYYTGLVFDVLHPAIGTSLGGGGRYDGLCASFGAALPAVGFALDAERLLDACVAEGSGGVDTHRAHLHVEHDEPSESAAARLATRLREAGFAATLGPVTPAGPARVVRVEATGLTLTDAGSSSRYDSAAALLAAIGAGHGAQG